MMDWDYDSIEGLLDDAIGPVHPADPTGRKRLQILNAATGLFAKQGYRKTNVDEIARAAGVAKGTIYLYFKTKGAIAYSVIALEKKAHLEQMRSAFDPSIVAGERLRRFISSALLMVVDMPVLFRLLADPREITAVMLDMPSGALEQSNALGQQLYGDLLQEAAPHKLRPTTLRDRLQVLQIIGPLARTVTDAQIRGHLSPRKYVDVLADVLVAGLIHPEGGGKS
jgi:AcrR family transcriptional regulator